MGENPDNFLKEPVAVDTNSFTISSGAFVSAVNNTLFAVVTTISGPLWPVFFWIE